MTPAEKVLFDALCIQYDDVHELNIPGVTPESNAQCVLDTLIRDLRQKTWESHLWRSSFLGNEAELICNICLERDIEFDPLWMSPDFVYEHRGGITQREWFILHTDDNMLSEPLLALKKLLVQRQELTDALSGRRLDLTIHRIRLLHDHLKSRGALDTWHQLVAVEQSIKEMS
jgi:hypothetical protein